MFARLLIAALLVTCGMPAAAATSEQDVTLQTPTGTLAGTFVEPSGSKAAGLLIAGSGPTDRNGNSALGIQPDTLKLIAQGLAAQQIVTLRFDKRGIGQSAAAMRSEADLRIQTYVDDAKAWAADLRKRTALPCVWLIGHSEGALIAELVAQQEAGICGLVLISGPGRPLGTIIREQIAANPANPTDLKKSANDILDALEHRQTVTDVPPLLAPLFRPSVQPYLISEIDLDPAAILAQIKLPVLILQGDNDLQVSIDDARALASADSEAKLVILPGVNHVLKAVPPGNPAANVAAYRDPTLPLADGIVDNIAAFLK